MHGYFEHPLGLLDQSLLPLLMMRGNRNAAATREATYVHVHIIMYYG